jgi:hypothetical protein
MVEEKNIIIIYVDFLLFLGFERHALSYHLIKKVWWCSTTIGVESLPLVFTSNLERGRRHYYVAIDSSWRFVFLMYLRLHPPKHGKLHSCENFHYVNICHFHIGQWTNKFFIPKSNLAHICLVSSLWAKPKNKNYIPKNLRSIFHRMGGEGGQLKLNIGCDEY